MGKLNARTKDQSSLLNFFRLVPSCSSLKPSRLVGYTASEIWDKEQNRSRFPLQLVCCRASEELTFYLSVAISALEAGCLGHPNVVGPAQFPPTPVVGCEHAHLYAFTFQRNVFSPLFLTLKLGIYLLYSLFKPLILVYDGEQNDVASDGLWHITHWLNVLAVAFSCTLLCDLIWLYFIFKLILNTESYDINCPSS